jgi:integrase
MVVPVELRPVLGKSEFTMSLGTKDLSEAKRAYFTKGAAFIASVEDRIHRARNPDPWEVEDALEITTSAFFSWVDRDDPSPARYHDNPDPYEDLRRLGRGNLQLLVQAFLTERAMIGDVRPGTEPYRVLLREILAEIGREYKTREIVTSTPVPDDLDPLRAELLTSAKAAKSLLKPATVNGTLFTMAELYAAYARERRPEVKLVQQFAGTLKRFREIEAGRDLSEITRADCIRFKDLLVRMPRSMPRDWQDKPISEVVELVQPDAQRITSGSVNRYLQDIRVLFNYALANGKLTENPADGVNAITPKNRQPRLPYSDDDLKILFGCDIYQGKPTWNARYWIPLIGLFTGARLEEIAHMHLDDIVRESGIDAFRIDTIGDDQKVKTRGSRRLVPIHPKLVQLGLLRYVTGLRKRGETRLWPELTKSARDSYSTEFSKWYGRHARGLGITDPRKVFHSLRHTFKAACRRARIDPALHDLMTGHASGSVGAAYGLTFEAVAAEVVRVEYPSLPL